MSATHWTRTETRLPEDGTAVRAISPSGLEDDFWFERGLWFFPDRSMYVYYVPLFWRRIG